VIFGGFGPGAGAIACPAGAGRLCEQSATWMLGHGQQMLARAGARRVLVIGACGAERREVESMAEHGVPADAAWRWPGAYAVVEESPDALVIHTDPAAAYPVYGAAHGGRWAWSTCARVLAGLVDGAVDVQRLAAAVFLPSVPALGGSRSFFRGVWQLPPGCRIMLPAGGSAPCSETRWRPDPLPGDPAARLRDALSAGVSLRVARDPHLACDLSGGLDSTSLALLAATALLALSALDAVTIHPAGRLNGADLRHARAAAAAHPGRIRHHLLPLGPEHLPYTAITEVPATDEPMPSTLARARLAGQMNWMHETLGTRTHMTGDGGDSILFVPPIHLADLIRHRQRRRALREAAGWARLRHTGISPLLRDAYRVSRISRTEALHALADSIGTPQNEHGAVRWFPLLPHPAWAQPAAAAHLRAAARAAAAEDDTLPGLDASVRTLVDEVRHIARSAAADAALAEVCGIELHNPFLDAAVVHAALSVPLAARPPIYAYKPLLRAALGPLLPPRTTKGLFNADRYTGMRTNLPDLLELADGHLADLGLIEPNSLRRDLRRAAAGVPMPLAAIEQALTAEAWLRAHHRDPIPAWIPEPAGSSHA
jgi:asparagine synthase (glutamine-hydrolysing)